VSVLAALLNVASPNIWERFLWDPVAVVLAGAVPRGRARRLREGRSVTDAKRNRGLVHDGE
jgi:hypothetical protein